MTTVEHFWVNDGCTVTQYTVVLDYKTTWPGKMQTAVSSYRKQRISNMQEWARNKRDV